MSLAYQRIDWLQYGAETATYGLEQHGANLLLQCHFWINGNLPTQVAQFAEIWKVDHPKARALWNDVRGYFSPERCARLEAERAAALALSRTRALVGSRGGRAKHRKSEQRRLLDETSGR